MARMRILWNECETFMCVQFLKEFERFYVDANNGIFELDEWHDSFVFGHIPHSQMKSN